MRPWPCRVQGGSGRSPGSRSGSVHPHFGPQGAAGNTKIEKYTEAPPLSSAQGILGVVVPVGSSAQPLPSQRQTRHAAPPGARGPGLGHLQ